MGSRQVSSIPLQPLPQLLPLGSCLVYVPASTAFEDEISHRIVSEINPLPHKLLLVMVFHHSENNPKTSPGKMLIHFH